MPDTFSIDLVSRLTGQIAAFLNASLPEVIRSVQDSISIPVSQMGSVVVRSQPGEPPRLETGNLRGSIDGDVIVEGERVTLVVSASADYARYLEEGTPTIQPRPFLAPALQYWLDELPRRLSDHLRNTPY